MTWSEKIRRKLHNYGAGTAAERTASTQPAHDGRYGLQFRLLLGLGAAFGNELRRNLLLGGWEFSPQTPILGSLPDIVIESRRSTGGQFWRSALRIAGWSTPFPCWF